MDLVAIREEADAILESEGGQFVLRSETVGQIDPHTHAAGPPNVTEYTVNGIIAYRAWKYQDGQGMVASGEARFIFSAANIPAAADLDKPQFDVYVKATGKRIGRLVNIRPTMPDGQTVAAFSSFVQL